MDQFPHLDCQPQVGGGGKASIRVGENLVVYLPWLCSQCGAVVGTELFPFPLPLCFGGMCCTSSLRDTLDNTPNTNTWSKQSFSWNTNLPWSNWSCCSSCHPGDFGATQVILAPRWLDLPSTFPFSSCRAFPNGTWSDFQHNLYLNWSSCCSARCKFASFSPCVSRTKNCEHLILVGVNWNKGLFSCSFKKCPENTWKWNHLGS